MEQYHSPFTLAFSPVRTEMWQKKSVKDFSSFSFNHSYLHLMPFYQYEVESQIPDRKLSYSFASEQNSYTSVEGCKGCLGKYV